MSEDLDMAIDNEIGGTRHAHRQLDRWKQRRLPTTRSVATSSGSNIAVETMWDVGNSVDNNQDQLVNSGINRFRNQIQRIRNWNPLLGDFCLIPHFQWRVEFLLTAASTALEIAVRAVRSQHRQQSRTSQQQRS